MTNITTTELQAQINQCSPELQQLISTLQEDSERLEMFYQSLMLLNARHLISQATIIYLSTPDVAASIPLSEENEGFCLSAMVSRMKELETYGESRFLS